MSSDFAPKSTSHEILTDGMTEVKAKLRDDLSHWGRARKLVSLKPTMGCAACDATGKVDCSACGGAGQSKVVFGENPETCATCQGSGKVTCVDCAGKGWVPNVHRKKILWVLGIGGAAWLLVLLRLWMMNYDILPGFRSDIKGQASQPHGMRGGAVGGPPPMQMQPGGPPPGQMGGPPPGQMGGPPPMQPGGPPAGYPPPGAQPAPGYQPGPGAPPPGYAPPGGMRR